MVSASRQDADFAFYEGLGLSGSINDKQKAYDDLFASIVGEPVYVWGESYGLVSAQAWFTSGKHYLNKVADALRAPSLTSYAVGSRRIIDVCATAINAGQYSGTTGLIAAGKHTSVSARPGLYVIESMFNDVGHYPAMNVNPVVPAAITSADTKYLDGIKSMYRTALAVLSSESRVEQTAAVLAGAWTAASAQVYASGGTVGFTSAIGASDTYTVKPPQTGPMAGKVHFLRYKIDTAAGTLAPVDISIDGGAATRYTPTPWEQYTGQNAALVNVIPDCITVTLPIDNANHTVKFTHAGAAGNLMYSDCAFIPSVAPNPIIVMGNNVSPNVVAGTFDATGVANWVANMSKVEGAIRSVCAEFPHVIYVPSSMSQNGLSSGDGVHPNDRGMQQRANDFLAWLRTSNLSNQLRDKANSNFGKV